VSEVVSEALPEVISEEVVSEELVNEVVSEALPEVISEEVVSEELVNEVVSEVVSEVVTEVAEVVTEVAEVVSEVVSQESEKEDSEQENLQHENSSAEENIIQEDKEHDKKDIPSEKLKEPIDVSPYRKGAVGGNELLVLMQDEITNINPYKKYDGFHIKLFNLLKDMEKARGKVIANN
jgi:hypothetical protein